MMIVTPERAGHWYTKEGQPCFQVPKKNGQGTKDTTLREARELGLLPSVTGILKVINKPELEAWKQSQLVAAALTLPRQREELEEWLRRWLRHTQSATELRHISPTRQWLEWAYANPPRFTEDDQVFAAKAVEDAEAQGSEAAEFGKQIHKAIEEWLKNGDGPKTESVEPFLKSVKEWALNEIQEFHSAEKVVVNQREGYAGILDLHARLIGIGEAVVDFKSQSIKNGKPVFYDEWYYQLAAYAVALDKPDLALVSIVIDSKTPGPIFCHQWPEPERGWQLFKCALELWKYQKQYDPTRP